MLSTVDPDARHGHKSTARGLDGYKGHAAVDPDCEVITGAAVGPAGGGDAAMTAALLDDLATTNDTDRDDCHDDTGGDRQHRRDDTDHDGRDGGGERGAGAAVARPVVYGDAAYGSGDNLALLERLGADPMVKTQAAVAPGGRFTKDDFAVDLATRTVTCPAGHSEAIPDRDAAKVQVRFAAHCADCQLRSR